MGLRGERGLKANAHANVLTSVGPIRCYRVGVYNRASVVRAGERR